MQAFSFTPTSLLHYWSLSIKHQYRTMLVFLPVCTKSISIQHIFLFFKEKRPEESKTCRNTNSKPKSKPVRLLFWKSTLLHLSHMIKLLVWKLWRPQEFSDWRSLVQIPICAKVWKLRLVVGEVPLHSTPLQWRPWARHHTPNCPFKCSHHYDISLFENFQRILGCPVYTTTVLRWNAKVLLRFGLSF